MNSKIMVIVSIAILTAIFFTQVTFFVVPPIGAAPEGKILLMLRMNKTNFIDSADSICAREMKGVSLWCRGMTIAAIANKGTVLSRLPYSQFLYNISTDGKAYGR